MESLGKLYEFMTNKDFSVPLGQVILFVVLLTIFLLYGRHKLGLVVTFLFVFYWGYVVNFGFFKEMLGGTPVGMAVYVVSGIAMVFLAILGFFLEGRD